MERASTTSVSLRSLRWLVADEDVLHEPGDLGVDPQARDAHHHISACAELFALPFRCSPREGRMLSCSGPWRENIISIDTLPVVKQASSQQHQVSAALVEVVMVIRAGYLLDFAAGELIFLARIS